MASRSSRQFAKAKAMKDWHATLLCAALPFVEAQRVENQQRNGLPRTIAEWKEEIARKIAPQQQALREAVVQTAWEHHPVSVIVCDAGGRIILASAGARQMARMQPEGMLLDAAPSIWGKLLPGGGKPGITGWPQLRSLLTRPTPTRECRLIQSGDAAYDVMFSSAPLSTANQTRAGAVLMFTDVTLVKREEAILRERAVKEERRRMAAELHDTLCQGLNAIVLMLQAAQTFVGQDGEPLQRLVQRSHEVAKDTLREARRSMWTFSREAAGDMDPAASLALVAEQIFNDTPVHYELSLQEQPFDLPSRIRFELLRIGKEALTNVRKHSQATKVQMALAYRKRMLQLSVMDDGRGFVPGSSGDMQHGYGLTSMRQRTEGLGGKFIVESQPQRGTKVVAYIPLASETSATLMVA